MNKANLIIKKQAKAECSNKQFTAIGDSLSDLRRLSRVASLTNKLGGQK